MHITTETIRTVEPLAQLNCADKEFDYIDIIGFSAKPDITGYDNVLWCVTESTTKEDLSWYGVSFDRTGNAPDTARNFPGWVILTDNQQLARSLNTACILVPDIKSFLEQLHRHVVDLVRPNVIGVTGSVGKTTAVALLEDVFSNYGKTLRIYAKRLAPLIIFELIINQLEEAHKYVVLEYAMFYRWHVGELVRLLPPTIGILLNIESAHVGVDGIRDASDILNAKRSVLDTARHGFVEREVVQQLAVGNFQQSKDCLPGVSVFDWHDFIAPAGFHIDPFVKSRLQYIQIGAALSAKRALIGEVTADDIDVINQFEPKENRLRKIQCERYVIFFDGEATNAARLQALADTDYPARVLILHEVEFYNQHLDEQRDQTIRALERFDAVFINRGINGRFRDFIDSSANSVEHVKFYDGHIAEPLDGFTIFVHWGAYWRTHSDDTVVRRQF